MYICNLLLCFDILNVNYACRPKAFGGEPLTVAKLESDGWELVFRATAGNGEIPFNSWTNGNTVFINYLGFCVQFGFLFTYRHFEIHNCSTCSMIKFQNVINNSI